MKKNSFTLIELLVVVMIISLLSGAVLTMINVTGIKAKSRDAQRVADLQKLRSALELYYQDYRAYPPTEGNAWRTVSSSLQQALVTGGYISVLPIDPLNSGTATSPCFSSTYRYFYRSIGGVSYALASSTENESSATPSLCSSLKNASAYGLGGCTTLCYGLENPL